MSSMAVTPPGRSPRVRGRPDAVVVHDEETGSIPAGAGETYKEALRHDANRVDPRGCGGDRGLSLMIPRL